MTNRARLPFLIRISTICDSYDNAIAEALNGTLHRPWRTRRQLEIMIIEWIEWYNRRLHSEIGNIPPAECETLWYLQRDLAETVGKY
ncbi:MAG: integrase core domain-containing protein [Ilumatobacteraceae bacterium]